MKEHEWNIVLRAIAWGCSSANKLKEDLVPYFEAFSIAHHAMLAAREEKE